jgi:hypothetical protein
MPQVIKNQITQLYKKARIPSIERMNYFFVRRRKKCGRKVKQEYKIGQNLDLCRRKEEKRKKKKLARLERQRSR